MMLIKYVYIRRQRAEAYRGAVWPLPHPLLDYMYIERNIGETGKERGARDATSSPLLDWLS